MEKKVSYYFIIILVTSATLSSISCKNVADGESESPDILEDVEEVSEISGAEAATITVNKDQQAFFKLEFENINPNDVISNGSKEGWCIDWQKPIDSDNGTYNGITLYNTYLVKSWKRVNYLLNVKEELLEEDPDLTYREIQVAIWSLRANPEFNLDEVKTEDLPNRMVTDGQRNFSTEKVKETLAKVEAGYDDFEFTEGTKFAVIGATPADVQTVIAVVE